MSRRDPLTPDLRAAARDAFVEASGQVRDAGGRIHEVIDFERFMSELRDNLRRMDVLGMDWRGRS